jgi:hypothetical protein
MRNSPLKTDVKHCSAPCGRTLAQSGTQRKSQSGNLLLRVRDEQPVMRGDQSAIRSSNQTSSYPGASTTPHPGASAK